MSSDVVVQVVVKGPSSKKKITRPSDHILAELTCGGCGEVIGTWDKEEFTQADADRITGSKCSTDKCGSQILLVLEDGRKLTPGKP